MNRALSINSDVFSAMKADFDTMLTKTLYSMELRQTSSAKISLKLAIDIERLFDPQTGEPIMCPKFTHEVSSVMQIKEKLAGTIEGDYKLSRNSNGYSLSFLDEQIDMLDDMIVEEPVE